MSRYGDYRRSTGALDEDHYSRERERHRHRHRSRGPPVLERPRRVEEDDRFEYRLQEQERYGPPARRSEIFYEDEHLAYSPGPLVTYRHAESPPPRPRLLRRQSSLDTFDRPTRKIDEYYYSDYPPRAPPSPPPMRRRGSFHRVRSPDYYEEIRIAEPDYYGDEEYREFRERDRIVERPRRSVSRFRERMVEEVDVEKPYPRKGKTRMPRKLVHTSAIREFGYPYEEEGKMIIIQVALSKEQIDEVISRSREMKRMTETRYKHTSSPSPVRDRQRDRIVERIAMESYTPRTSHETLLIEPSPSRHRSRSRHHHHHHHHGELEEKKITRTVSRTRNVSVQGRPRRRSSPVRRIERYDDGAQSTKLQSGPLAIVVRPRDSDDDLREYTQIERRGGGEMIRDTEIIGDGEEEEILEVKKDRRVSNYIMDKFQAFGKNLSASFSPFAARTQQMIKEQLGQADDRTQLPDEYIELEKRVDALKIVHQKLLQVTSQYSNEAYDYPPNIRESFNDMGRTISEKVQLLSQASSPAEAQAALTAPPSAKPQPKTFNHAIARASLAGSQTLAQSSHGEDPLATALEKYALASEKVGEARLAQDAQIQSRFLAGWNTTLNTNLMFAAKARKNVENARLMLDSIKASKKAAVRGDWDSLSEEARAEIEQAEDEFVGQTEEAVSVMKNVLDTPEPLRNLADLIAAQLEYHKRSYEILSELAPVVDGLQVEQEASYRKSREGA
ncbi:BAR domain-containing protein [Aspergillus niger CBS 101883]|uniref:BAR domain protein n=2 Tax=Aspergillus TaxID=5052 RepID=A0A370PI70_ASPPH|nr:BAR domain protein [Aspergillus niger CBS 101883]PYH62810.1 BAR domain protein [Aspergillus niger CBS 101883]RDH25214.1 BAR domain protein [Aspergillus niger ATCC 13496]RDK41883.1 BAR domain protein [Aspergillus phoenicis ATCC 13157]